jgi:hypothetical protein
MGSGDCQHASRARPPAGARITPAPGREPIGSQRPYEAHWFWCDGAIAAMMKRICSRSSTFGGRQARDLVLRRPS